MQPPRPFLGATYDKDMFTFLPAPSTRDVLAESSRKRKSISSDCQINIPAPTVRFGFEMSEPKVNTGDWQGRVPQSSGPSSLHGESLHSGDNSHVSRCWDRHNFAETWDSKKRNLHETRSGYSESSIFSGQLQSSDHKVSSPLFHKSEVQTPTTSTRLPSMSENFNHFENFVSQKPVLMKSVASSFHDQASKNQGESQSLQKNIHNSGTFVVDFDGKGCRTRRTSAWFPSMSENLNQLESYQSNACVAREKSVSYIQELYNIGLENPVQVKAVASASLGQVSKNLGELHQSQQNFVKPGASVVVVDGKSCPAEAGKVESSSNVKRSGDTCTSAGCDSTRVLGDDGGNFAYSLQCKTNDLLQHALKLVSMSSGIGLAGCYSGKIQDHGDVKMMNLTPDSASQNVKHSQAETALSNKSCLNLGKPSLNGEKGSTKLAEECKSVNGASTPTEKLWDGTLQLSSSVSVSAVAFFKSGEKMQDFSWSKSVDVKGKVRLEAFEKYVQDLPRSRTRGLMVISFCLKEGSSNSDQKSVMEVARKYKERKRVGFAQLSSGLDMYICPHSDTIITILAKYGFFKGMAAVKDKCEPLLGCIVWRKNASSGTTTKTTKVNDPQSRPSLNSPSDSSAAQVAGQNSAMPIKTEEPITGSSEKGEQLTESREKSREKSPEFCASPHADQPKHPTALQSSVASIYGNNTQFSEYKTDMKLDRPGLPVSSVAPKQSAVNSDDDDLPEYDFRVVVSHTSASRAVEVVDSKLDAKQCQDNHVPTPISAQKGRESSTVPGPNSYFQGLVPHSIGLQCESHVPSMPAERQMQIKGHSASQQPPDFQAILPENIGRQPDKIPSLLLQQQKQLGNSATSLKTRNLFDDDMPEWCPPDLTKPRQEIAQGARQLVGSGHTNVSATGFTESASCHLPSLPSTPPLTQLQFQDKNYPSAPHLLRALADKPVANRFSNEGTVAFPGFAPNPAFRP